ncbi:MAG: primase [Bradyrhizobium sp.]|nr:primase [Bradyrhizobium sp.]
MRADPYSAYAASVRQPARRPRLDGDEFRRLVDEAKARHNLSDIVGRHTKLNRRGPRELVGLCPFHVEKSPSFEVNDTKGAWHCWGGCGGGDAMSFLMRADGLDFMGAYRVLAGDDFPVVSEADRAKRKADDAADMARRVAIALGIWSQSVPPEGTPAEVYARSRDIAGPLPDTVRFVMAPRWRDPETGEVGRDYPAMACALHDGRGDLVGVQCVFLAAGGRTKYQRVRDDGTKAKAKLSYGNVIGSAFRASGTRASGSPEIIVCEGPEDGLTLAQGLPDADVYVACGTNLMPRVTFPAETRAIVLAGDNNPAGRGAVEAATLAFEGLGLTVRAMYPDAAFKDWNDELRGVRA